MKVLFRAFRALIVDESGGPLVEYALLAATLGVAMITGTGLLEGGAKTVLTNNANGWVTITVTPP
jgi:Flp pilus assembly pilin Flp